MSELRGAAIFGQSGGPTSVINASACGVFQEALSKNALLQFMVQHTASKVCLKKNSMIWARKIHTSWSF